MFKKSEADEQAIQLLYRLEQQGDKSYEGLDILRLPRNQAAWTILTEITFQLEQSFRKTGGGDHPFFAAASINLARAGTIAMNWIQKHGNQTWIARSKFKWTPSLSRFAYDAIGIARGYDTFLSYFPLWHKDCINVEILGPTSIAFRTPRDSQPRRVSAFQKGMFPSGKLVTKRQGPKPWIPISVDVKSALQSAFHQCKRAGKSGFAYPEPYELYEVLFGSYLEALSDLFRRDDKLSLGQYDFNDFRSCFAALLSVCAVHENFCWEWEQAGHLYPHNSVVLVWTREKWSEVLQNISGLGQAKVQYIISDLTPQPSRTRDLLVQLFVPLDQDDRLLGVVPHFVLKSNSEENIGRICSYDRPTVYDQISLSKENELRSDLLAYCKPKYYAEGPISLPGDNPDIDLLIWDPNLTTLVFVELKWIRKALRTVERIDRDKEVLHGIEQLQVIKDYMGSNPLYLQNRGIISRSLEKIENVHFLVVARDHFLWTDPVNAFPTFESENFKRAIEDSKDLDSAIQRLLRYEWLPVEDKDFEVRLESFLVNSVRVSIEIFYARQQQ